MYSILKIFNAIHFHFHYRNREQADSSTLLLLYNQRVKKDPSLYWFKVLFLILIIVRLMQLICSMDMKTHRRKFKIELFDLQITFFIFVTSTS